MHMTVEREFTLRRRCGSQKVPLKFYFMGARENLFSHSLLMHLNMESLFMAHKNKGRRGPVFFWIKRSRFLRGQKRAKSTPQVTLARNEVTAYITFHNSFAGKPSSASTAVDKRS